LKNYYELLGLEQTAQPEDVKRAFRREIARYHPDKVQHLGPEFQEIAANRAAELTEAYRILMDPAARKAYDASVAKGEPPRPGQPDAAKSPEPARESQPSQQAAQPRPAAEAPTPHISESLRATQATMSAFVRKATVGRLREAIEAVFGSAAPFEASGFDAGFDLKPRRGLFQKSEAGVHLLARVVPKVDEEAIRDAWPLAVKAGGRDQAICLLLLGLGLAPVRELASVIAEHRRRTRQGAPIVIPVDARDWDALFPPETPPGVRKVLERLKLGV
jgi:hypothetical protein